MTILKGRRKVFLLLLITLLITLLCGSNCNKEHKKEEITSYRHSWKIQEGDITSYVANIELSPLFKDKKDLENIPGKPKMVYKIPYLLKAAHIKETEIEWEVQFGNLEFETNIPFAVPPDGRAIKRSTGKIRTDIFGNVLSISGFEALGLPGGAILPGEPVVVFPDKEIHIGETWGNPFRYQLDNIENGKVSISYESENPVASGKVRLDANTGVLVRLEDTRKLKGEMEMEIKTTVQKQ